MENKRNIPEEVEILNLIKTGKATAPNAFTIEMGKLIKTAREKKGLSQAKLAEKLNRRPATISDIENGKSEIGIFTLIAFALEFDKPVSYFFPETIMKDHLIDIKSKFEYDILEEFRGIENYGNPHFAYKLLEFMNDYYETRYFEDNGN